MKFSHLLIVAMSSQAFMVSANQAQSEPLDKYVGDSGPNAKQVQVIPEKVLLKHQHDAPLSEDSKSEAATASAPTANKGSTEESDEIKLPKNFIHSSTVMSKSNCKIRCLDPHAANDESAQVIDILQKIYVAYADKDLDYIGEHLAQDCITFYEGDKKVISGKVAALADIKDWTEKEAKKTDAPLIEIILEHPYCNVNGDDAVITFTAIKEIGGAHSGRFKSHVNDVFKKSDKSWELRTHYRSSWKELKEPAS